jgi:diguanylate cyclase (GGDEF)-like protein
MTQATETTRTLLLVAGDDALAAALGRAAPELQIGRAEGVFDALAQAAEGACGAALLPAALLGRRREHILRAFHKAAPAMRLTLLCPPSAEIEARAACRAGADDYVLLPIERDELRHALRLPVAGDEAAEPASMPQFAAEPDDARQHGGGAGHAATLAAAAELLSTNGAGLESILQRAVETVAAQVRAADAAVLALNARGEPETWACTAALAASAEGGPVRHEVALAQALVDGERVVGWLNLGPPLAGGRYSRPQADLVAGWGRLLARVVSTHRQIAHLQRLAVTDDLSGLYNRRYFDHFLKRIVQRAASERFRVTVMIFDIDDFKQYNDQYGHMVGDAIIRDVAMLMRRCTRPHDVVARFGGDEFAVIFWDNEQPRQPNSQHPHDALALAERFREEMGRHAFQSIGPNAQGRLTISGGLASFPWDGQDAAGLLQKADEALLAAKSEGKDRILLVGK